MKVAYWAFAATACILSASCGGKQQERKSEEIQKVTTDSITGTGKMQSSNISDTVTVRGTTYRYKIVRKADEELGKIKNVAGKEFFDNRIELTITKGTSEIFKHSFTRESFKSVAPAEFMKNSVLLGIVFNYDKAGDHSNFNFVASIGDPEDDELYFPMTLTITPDGQISIDKNYASDTAPVKENLAVDPPTDGGI